MARPPISNIFTISTHSDNAIAVLDRDDQGNPSQVAVDLYCDQSVSKNDDFRFQSYSTMFFGRRAADFVEYFEPGDTVHVSGTLYVKDGEYLDLNIRDSTWQFPPSGENSSQNSNADQQQDPATKEPETGPSTPPGGMPGQSPSPPRPN